MILEICAGSIESVIAARNGGAQRVELCSALSEGGLTPSVGLMRAARRVEGLKMHVLIRPRSGDFLYSREEIAIMRDDIRAAHDCGADGVVIGALNPCGTIDTDACAEMIAAAEEMSITFHRAFDMVSDADKALSEIIALGCHRILTSGLQPTAEEGIPMLRHLVEKAAGRIIIMPASGVSPQNARKIITMTGANEIHASARSEKRSGMTYRNSDVTMGAKDADEFARMETDETIVKTIISNLSL